MKLLVILTIAFVLGSGVADKDIKRKRVLVLYDNAALLTTHSIFIRDLTGTHVFNSIHNFLKTWVTQLISTNSIQSSTN